MAKKYRLVPELVPGDLWGRSAFQMLKGKAAWKKKIRPDAIAAANNKCQICADKPAVLVCHDKWKYDDRTKVATLIGFEVHCRMCDAVTHIGRTVVAVDGNGEQLLADAIQTLCNVNKCTPDQAVKIISDAMEQWTVRSQSKWDVEVSPKLLSIYPELQPLPNFRPTERSW